MKKIALLLCLFALFNTAYAKERVYFKIAINDSDYSSFLTDNAKTQQEKLKYLATRMLHSVFHPEVINGEYYKVVKHEGIKTLDIDAVQYDIIPIKNDRFRQIVMVDPADNVILKKETYDTNGKLIFAFIAYEKLNNGSLPQAVMVNTKKYPEFYNGYHIESDRVLQDGTKHISLSDGVNRFSVFRKKVDIAQDIEDKRIVYGNYVYRHKIGDELFTVVGTLPFNEMKQFVDKVVYAEEK